MKPNDLTLDERREQFLKRIREGKVRRLPTPVAVIPVSKRVADAVKENPESVRVAAKDARGISIVERPQHTSTLVSVMVDYVREVDANGRPVWDRPGAVHEYDLYTRL